MTKTWPLLLAVASVHCADAPPPPPAPPVVVAAAPPPVGHDDRLAYPVAHKGGQVDDYHGTKVADPYRWLESLDSAETRDWVTAENQLTFGYLEKIPSRQPLRDRMTALWNYERYSPPSREGDRYFFSRNTGLQNQSVIPSRRTRSTGRADDAPRPEHARRRTARDGAGEAPRACRTTASSPRTGSRPAGSDWQDWHVRDVASDRSGSPGCPSLDQVHQACLGARQQGALLQPLPRATRRSPLARGRQLLQQALLPPARHTPGRRPARLRDAGAQGVGVRPRGHRGRALPGHHRREGDRRQIHDPLPRPSDEGGEDGPADRHLRQRLHAHHERRAGPLLQVEPRGSARQGHRHRYAPPRARELEDRGRRGARETRRRVVHQRRADPELPQGRPHAGEGLRPARASRCTTSRCSGLGTASAGLRRETQAEGDVLRLHESYSRPATVYRLDLGTFESTVYKAPKLAFNPDDYETRQEFYASKDGTQDPDLHHGSKRGLKLDGSHPTLLYGYGGFNIPLTPAFSVPTWSVHGAGRRVRRGQFARWRRVRARNGTTRGRSCNKQRVFDDFIAAAEWLIHSAGYTSTSSKLAIAGGSNGGLLVGASAVTQRPGPLLRRRSPAVGVMDMLRFNKFTIGHSCKCDDYGSRDDAERVQGALRLLTAPQHQGGDEVSGDADHDRGRRRPRRARA